MHPIFIGTEFSGLTQHASLLSIALVPKQGKWFYAVFEDVDTTSLSEWHQENVVPHLALTPQQLEQLGPGRYPVGGTAEIVAALGHYLAAFDQVIICADVPAYDWGLFCELFGEALSLPNNIHYIVRDLATLLEAEDWSSESFTLDNVVDYNEFHYFYDYVREALYDYTNKNQPAPNGGFTRHLEYKELKNATYRILASKPYSLWRKLGQNKTTKSVSLFISHPLAGKNKTRPSYQGICLGDR